MTLVEPSFSAPVRKRYSASPANRAVILVYHHVGDAGKSLPTGGLYVTLQAFKLQMWYLKAAGYRVVSLKEMLAFASGDKKAKNRGPMAALTFDDGYIDFYENAFPVLKKYGYPSTVFMVSGLAGRTNLWDRAAYGYGHEKRLLGWQKASELSEGGVTFGAHTRTHPHLTSISASRMKEEILGSKLEIEDRTGRQADFFCYPYGDYNGEVVRVVKEAGFLGATSTRRGYVLKGDDRFELKRMSAGPKTWLFSMLPGAHFGH